jgi:hypothetical protein
MPITFQVNLQTLNLLSTKGPYSSNDPQGANFALTRSTWFPDFLRDNHQLHHGDLISASGDQALYLLNNYTFGYTNSSNLNSQYCFLNYVSGEAVP